MSIELIRSAAVLALATCSLATAQSDIGLSDIDWKSGDPGIVSVGALAPGPDGVLFVGDAEGAAVYAFQIGRADAKPVEAAAGRKPIAFDGLDEHLAGLMGTKREEIRIHDLAVDEASGAAYLSLTRGGGDSAQPAIVRVRGDKDVEILDLSKTPYLRASLANAPEPDGGGRRSKRAQSVTDLAFHNDVLYVAGLSNEEFASKLRAMEFPFADAGEGTSIEVYHAAHGAWETRSPVRVMVPIDIGGSPHLLCGYTCTPLVTVPVKRIDVGEKFVGTTVAELGNRNTPLDMVVYTKGEERFVLIANTSRGVMKVSTENIDGIEGLTEKVSGGGTAGLPYETIGSLSGVAQLAPFDDARAVILVQDEKGASLRTIDLP